MSDFPWRAAFQRGRRPEGRSAVCPAESAKVENRGGHQDL